MSDLIAFFALIVSLGSLSLAYKIYLKDREYTSDKDLFEQLKNTLNMAYEAIVLAGDNETPTSNRLQWLISARHIERYRKLKLNLQTPLYNIICEEHENYWSDQFYKIIGKIPGPEFFVDINEEQMTEEGIDIRSAAIIYSFASWSDRRKDPIENISLEKIINDYKLYTPINYNFWRYFMRIMPNQAQKILNNIKP